MSGSTAAVLVSEYLFSLVKAKGHQNVLKSFQEKNIFEPEFFAITYINYHGTCLFLVRFIFNFY